MAEEKKSVGVPDSVALLLFFVFWYVGNGVYNMTNTMAITAVGKNSGLTMTVSTMQLGVCTLYAMVLWLIRINPIKLCGLQKPEPMTFPKLSKADIMKTLPVGFCSAAAHSAGVFCLGADPLFGQIVKAGEPVMSAAVNTVFYKKSPSMAKVVCLLFIVGGVGFASLKKLPGCEGLSKADMKSGTPCATPDDMFPYKLKFDQLALIFGMIGNSFAAFKGSENSKLMADKDLKARFGGVANQFAVTEVLAFAISLPVMFFFEGAKFGEFCSLLMTSKELQFGLAVSGLSFYLYNELATMTIKHTGAVTSSVANTAKRVIVLVIMAPFTGKPLTEEQKIGAAVAIFFVFVYSVIDEVLKKLNGPKTEAAKKGQ